MHNCAVCGRETRHGLTLQEVLTMHVRGLQERRVQALGEQIKSALCDDCLHRHVEGIRNPGKALLGTLLGFGAMSAVGAALYFLPPGLLGFSLRIPGILLAVTGVLAILQGWKRLREKQQLAQAGGPELLRSRFALEALLPALPQRSGENNISYIEVNDDLKEQSISALVQSHKLLPQIARQLHDRLRGKPELPTLQQEEDDA